MRWPLFCIMMGGLEPELAGQGGQDPGLVFGQALFDKFVLFL
jgi:hypothetical protein